MNGFIWWHDTLVVGSFFVLCVAGLLISQYRAKNKPVLRGATRV